MIAEFITLETCPEAKVIESLSSATCKIAEYNGDYYRSHGNTYLGEHIAFLLVSPEFRSFYKETYGIDIPQNAQKA